MPLNTIGRLSCLVACVSAAAAAALFGTTEIDLVFPRNDTFAPMPLLPVVFAMQNPPVSKMLWTRLEYGVGPLGHANLSADFHDFDDLTDMPSNDTSTYFVYTGVADRVNTEGKWELWWRFRAMNCSISYDPKWKDRPYGELDQVKDGFHWQEDYTYNRMIFTTRNGGQGPDIISLTSDEDCNKAQGLAFDVIGNLKTPQRQSADGFPSCAQLATSTPTPYPCQASVSPAAVSSISSILTQRECYAATPAVSCPPKQTSAAGNLNHGRAGWFIMAFGWLLYAIFY